MPAGQAVTHGAEQSALWSLSNCSRRTLRKSTRCWEWVVITMPARTGVWQAFTSRAPPSSTMHNPQLPLARGARRS